MKKTKERSYSRSVKEAAILLGKYIQLGRKERGLTEMDLAARAGISRATLQKMEQGNLKCELGLFFEVATLVGIPLFDLESSNRLASYVDRVNDKLAVLPKSIHKKKMAVEDDF